MRFFCKEIAKEIDGGGGGQKFFATAGGAKTNGVDKALEQAKRIVINLKASKILAF